VHMLRLNQFVLMILLWCATIAPAAPFPTVGAHSEIITEAVRLGQPERAKWEVVDDLRVTALYAELRETSVCLLSYDLCEITRDVGPQERDRIAQGLANALITRFGTAQKFPFDRLSHTVRSVSCAVREDFPASTQEAQKEITHLRQRLASLKRGPDSLRERKDLTERIAFYRNAIDVLDGLSYLLPGEAARKSADFEISSVRFGEVLLLNFPGELFSSVCSGFHIAADGPVIVTSFADGVSGYLMPAGDFKQGGYEWTWALFAPESMTAMRRTALRIIKPD
jgi:hypothetical protein